jgi:hypothetical protein
MEILVNGKQVRYRYVEKKHIRNSYLRFRGDMLVVTARDERKAIQIMEENREWIERHYLSINESARLFDSNSLRIDGQRYIALLNRTRRPSVELNKDVVIFSASGEDAAERLADRWLSGRSIELVSGIVNEKAAEHGMRFSSIRACRGSRWGSCSSKKELSFNRYLCMVPRRLTEYVVAHELAHTIHLNHSPAFWKEVARICPEYKTLRKELKGYDSYRRRLFLKAE